MIKLKSKLENNIIDGVLIKKGLNHIEDTVFDKLKQNKTFIKFLELGFISNLLLKKVKEVKTEINNKPDFASMSYEDLKKYVKDNRIEVKSMKKADILEALGV